MPDREGLRALHRHCESVSGANWRPTRFQDESTLSRCACSVCHVIPSTTVMLPCSHLLCEQCLTGSVRQDGERVCPLDVEPFSEDECQMIKLPSKTKQNLKAHCWNEDDGCQFVGTIEAVLLHYDRECAFHALQCPRCDGRILRQDIAEHYVAGCSENVPFPGGAPKERQDGPSVGCDASGMLVHLPTTQRQVNELSRTPDSHLFQDIRRAVSDLESTCLCGMTAIEANICSMVTRQLNAGLEELKALIRDLGSNHVLTMQSQMNELVEQSSGLCESQIQEIVRVLRDAGSELKEDVKAQLEAVAPLLRASESRLMENANTHLQKIVHAVKDTGEHISRVEANLSLTLSNQHQSLRGELDRLRPKKESTGNEGTLAAADVVKKDNMPWRTEKKLILRKLEVFAEESLTTLELLRQQTHMQDKKPRVSDIYKYWQMRRAGRCEALRERPFKSAFRKIAAGNLRAHHAEAGAATPYPDDVIRNDEAASGGSRHGLRVSRTQCDFGSRRDHARPRRAESSAPTLRIGERRQLATDALRGRVGAKSLSVLRVSRDSKHNGNATLFAPPVRAVSDGKCPPRRRKSLSPGRRALLRRRVPDDKAAFEGEAEAKGQ
ncbi:hypothetical protein HPB50_017877 [Hyalomma asiaticum]|uniref:Uncharacterized protein n=1 Tax=Hyalomma asiaticum TaxID=266040 RepID=A0ACB7RP55_HYAAI|nr:hypothetical protein HPB50_017877 [Hyalomma asiaticum]